MRKRYRNRYRRKILVSPVVSSVVSPVSFEYINTMSGEESSSNKERMKGCSRSFAHPMHVSKDMFALQSKKAAKSTSVLHQRSSTTLETMTCNDINAGLLPFLRQSSDALSHFKNKNPSLESVDSVDILFLESEKEYSLPSSPFPVSGKNNCIDGNKCKNLPILDKTDKKKCKRKISAVDKPRVKMFYIGTSDESDSDSGSFIENKPASARYSHDS